MFWLLSTRVSYVNNSFLRAEAKPPDVVLVQLLDAQRQVGRSESAEDAAL